VTTSLAASPSDHRHVLAIPTHGLPAFAAGVACFVGVEFVRRTFRVRCLPTLARDLTLLAAIHGRESTVAPATAIALSIIAAVA
jgi:hypothetical protein